MIIPAKFCYDDRLCCRRGRRGLLLFFLSLQKLIYENPRVHIRHPAHPRPLPDRAAVLLWHVDAHGCLFPAGIPKGVALAFLGELSETILQGRYKKGAASSARPSYVSDGWEEKRIGPKSNSFK